MSAIKEPSQKRHTATGRTNHRAGKWIESLKTSDVNQIWNELHRIVCHHPLVRASRSAGLLVEEGSSRQAHTDLTQELFVALLSKERFQHYLDSEMTDSEVEAEISQIELTNLLTAELRKRYPESYRLARRISTLVQSSPKFRRFDVARNLNGDAAAMRRLADRIYGLSVWFDGKPRRNQNELQERIGQVPMQKRDTRNVGCTGDAQIVISNADLETLIVRVFDALDSPTDIRSIRSLVMSRLPVMDIFLVPISSGGAQDSDDDRMDFEPADGRDTPEQSLLRGEAEDLAANSVDRFLSGLSQTVRGKTKQYNRIVGVLWHCYLSTEGGTQLEVADVLGVSDSLVSDYRRRIEAELQALSFTEIEQARRFEHALRMHVREMIESQEPALVQN
jgi:hypothetical protein